MGHLRVPFLFLLERKKATIETFLLMRTQQITLPTLTNVD